uniref:BTB domain-containing protein n=1 Tax=Acrobeloides nanus TaxID=290746 RepID=A0A914DYG4_9BILA
MMLNLATKKKSNAGHCSSHFSSHCVYDLPSTTMNCTTPNHVNNKKVSYQLSKDESFDDMDDERDHLYTQIQPTTSSDIIFKLNVGGKSYRIRSEMVLTCREPSLMTKLISADHEERLKMTDGYSTITEEYYLERNVRVADHVIDYFVSGLLHKPEAICTERFREELEYWQLNTNQLAPCCSMLDTSSFPQRLREKQDEEREFDGAKCSAIRKLMWEIMEDPSSSFLAKIFSFISIVFIFSSVIGLIMGSMPEFQEDPTYAHFYHSYHQFWRQNSTRASKFDGSSLTISENELDSSGFVYKPTDSPNSFLIGLEYVCISWFTVEYIARFLVSPRKMKFVTRGMNLIDLFTILPFYVELALSAFGINAERLKELTGAMLVIRILRVLRMARVFKLARYSTGLQIFGNTLRASMTELSMLSMFLITGTVFFSTVMYFIERDEPNTAFYSIPAAMWWCITTVTTVGYGDVLVMTTIGKTVATVASICGIIILAFPISMIVEKFACAQQQAILEDQLRQAQVAAVANDYLLRRFPARRKVPGRDPMQYREHAQNGKIQTIA